MNPSEDPSDRLVDSLLREQARGKADEALLQSIEEKLGAVVPVQRQADPRGSRRLWMPLSAAAAVVLCGVGSYVGTYAWKQSQRAEMDYKSSHVVAESAKAPVRDIIVPEAEAKDLARANASVEAAPPKVTANGATAEAQMPEPAVEVEFKRLTDIENPLLQPLESGAPGAVAGATGSGGGRGAGSGSGLGRGQRHDLSQLPPSSRNSKEIEQNMLLWGTPNPPPDAFAGAADSLAPPAEEALAEAPDASERRSKLVPSKAKAPAALARENYGPLVDQPWKSPWQEALSTFSIDVDNASYTNLRRMIQEGRTIPADAVRIEECLNYFDYRYEGPKGDGPFAVHGDLATCPWKPGHLLARVAIKGKEIPNHARPASNLVFLVDVSGSMQSPDKLPLLKRSMRVLIDQLDERDRVGMVVYAGTEGVVLEPTLLDERGKSRAIQALEKLEAGGSTNGGAGIKRAYEMARKHLVQGGTNRVILATDGDFNVGTTGQGDLVNLVKNGSGNRIYLSVLGFGTGNLNDAMLEAITKDGNGNYFYVDNDGEARRVFLQRLSGTLVTIAKDVKIQVEFNPGKVKAYRLIGYANRILRHEDFNNDRVDAGDIGAGHTVTAFYEIVPDGVAMPDTGVVDALRYQRPAGKDAVASEDWFTLKLRHKHPEGDTSSLIETPVKGEARAWEQAGNDFRFASAVALFGMKLRQMPDVADVPWSKVESIAKPALAEDPQEQRSEFIGMVRKIGAYDPSLVAVDAVEAPVGDAVALSDLSYVGMRSVKWFVEFGLEGNGGWAPKLVGQSHDKKRFSNRVGAAKMIRPGDRFFEDGEMAHRFRFIGFTEKEVTGRRTNLSQAVKVAIYEDLKPGKAGKRYESQYGLPDAEIDAAAYLDHSAVFEVSGPANKELVVEEGSRFGGAEGGGGQPFLLKEVTPDHVVVEYADEKGVLKTVTIPVVAGR
jgi:Ca-activated chloride channel family protein